MKKMLASFREFIARGNVLDMAIGVILATAFGKITTALVNNVLMPFIGWLFGGSDAAEALNITLKAASYDAEGNLLAEATVLGLGTFLNAILDFLIIAFICFVIVKAFNKARALSLRKKQAEEAAAPPAPPEPSREEALLVEIRDLLKSQSAVR